MVSALIAIPSKGKGGLDGFASEHFGRCESFTFVKIEDGRIKEVKAEGNPFYESHAPFKVPEYLSSFKPDFVVCDGIGPRAVDALGSYGIRTIFGCAGRIGNIIKSFTEEKLHEGENSCHHA